MTVPPPPTSPTPPTPTGSLASPEPVAPLTPFTPFTTLNPLTIRLGERSYDILIGPRLLDAPASFAGLAAPSSVAAIVSNTTVAPLYADRLAAAIAPHHRAVRRIVLPDGEAHKEWPTLDRVFDALLEAGADRKTVLYALGGGVVGDITGFAAACYMRGIDFVQVPTTLLAQVDSSVGGKTGINHPRGKNMVGAFHQPLRVVADLDTLATLPPREVSAGLAEVVKTAAVADVVFFAWLEAHMAALRALDRTTLAHAVRRCCELKAWVVEQDEREAGLRAILNFGHTFGHAIEAGMGYGTWLHGEAVGAGMVMAAELSAALGTATADVPARLRRLLARAGLPVRGPMLGAERYMALMRGDKKAEGGQTRYVLLDGVGRALVRAAPDEVVRRVLAVTTDEAAADSR